MNPSDWEDWKDPDVIVPPNDPMEAFNAGLKHGIDHNMKKLQKAWKENNLSLDMFDYDEMMVVECARKNDFVFFMGNQDRIDALAKIVRALK